MAENMNKTARFSKSVGAGIKSVLNPSGREFYVLEYKNDSKQHKKGDKQKVTVEYDSSNCTKHLPSRPSSI